MIESVGSNLAILVTLAGIWVLVGMTLIHRDPAGIEPPRTPLPTNVDVEAARGTARAMLMLVILLGALALFLWLAAPGFSGGGMMYEPPWYEVALPWAGPAIYLIGLGWMIRIYRANPEPDETTWRYRS